MSGKKKFFGIGLLALLTTAYFTSSCSRDDMSGSMIDAKAEAFNEVFIETYGTPDPQHDWGFGNSATTRAFTRANVGETYPATHEYKDAYGNVIAGANMNHNHWADPNDYWGGWVVPDPLTEGQKERVRLYFQANPDLSYQDPGYRHFFVQQVYTGGTKVPTTGNHEATASAEGQTHAGMTLNQLTVGEAGSHINDFNAGTCSPSNVLDNGQLVNGTTHSDQITLMVNVYDTSCFGYHETSGGNVQTSTNHNDKMALVSAAVIDAWAAQNGNPGEAVTDKWNRSFMGFDYELLPECDVVRDEYALLSQVPSINDIHYAWDGEKVMTIGEAPETPQSTEREEFDLTPYLTENVSVNNAECKYENNKIVCTFNNRDYTSIVFTQRQGADWTKYDKVVFEFEGTSPVPATVYFGNNSAQISVGDTGVEIANPYQNVLGGWETITISTGNISDFDANNPPTLTIKKVTLVHEATTGGADNTVYYNPTYLLGDADEDKISFYSEKTNMYGGIIRNLSEDEMKTTQDGKTCLDLTLFQGLVADGYHPVSSDLKKWVKWQAACDGYYSDWIVTLTEAHRIGDDPTENIETINVQRIIDGRIFCEDLGQVTRADIDYNDVVFDAFTYLTDTYTVPYTLEGNNRVYDYLNLEYQGTTYNKTDINLLAAGGTLDITVAEQNVHQMLGVDKTTMTNTYTNVSPITSDYETGISPVKFTVKNENYINLSQIPIVVKQGNEVYELQHNIGDAPHKFLAPVGTPWVAERVAIRDGFTNFADWVGDRNNTPWGNANQANLYNLKFLSREGSEIGGGVENWQNYVNWNYYTIEVNGNGKVNGEENFITVNLDQPLAVGDQIAITAFRDNIDNAPASLYFKFSNGTVIEDTQIYNNIAFDPYEKRANTFVWTVTSAMAGSTSFQLSRNLTGGNIQIKDFSIISGLGPQRTKTVASSANVEPEGTVLWGGNGTTATPDWYGTVVLYPGPVLPSVSGKLRFYGKVTDPSDPWIYVTINGQAIVNETFVEPYIEVDVTSDIKNVFDNGQGMIVNGQGYTLTAVTWVQ